MGGGRGPKKWKRKKRGSFAKKSRGRRWLTEGSRSNIFLIGVAEREEEAKNQTQHYKTPMITGVGYSTKER